MIIHSILYEKFCLDKSLEVGGKLRTNQQGRGWRTAENIFLDNDA